MTTPEQRARLRKVLVVSAATGLMTMRPQADQSPKGQDRADGLDAQHASGGAEGMRQTPPHLKHSGE